MADKKIQLQDYQGNNLFPKTKAELVTTADGGNLASAQENKIETISLNGKEFKSLTKKLTSKFLRQLNILLPKQQPLMTVSLLLTI